jgi:hypothetical protein
MNLSRLCASFAEYLQSDDFLQIARHAEHPRAFSRERKLPLPALVASLVSGLCKSVQAELDEFFAHLQQRAALVRHVSAQAFAQARAKLHADALPALNDHLLNLIEQAGGVPRWHGLRRIAVDATHLRFGVRASHVPRAASRDALALGLYLPDAHLMLAAQLHSTCVGERQALFEQLHRFGTGDLLLLDRGYPCRWLVGLLQCHGIDFCMRVDVSGERGFALVRAFRKSDLAEQIVTLPRPDPQDVADFDCPPEPATVRLIRHVCADGNNRILMTSLMDTERFPAAVFADLYHERWSIEEAFKRLKHRLNIEHVSGLTLLAVQQDFAAKVLCDNLAAAFTSAARATHKVPQHRRTNRAYARTALKPLIPALLLGRACIVMLKNVIKLIASQTFKYRPGLSRPRPPRPKPHKHMGYKAC